jgi:hypothetical protein
MEDGTGRSWCRSMSFARSAGSSTRRRQPAMTVRRIVQLRGEGKSLREIATVLDSEGLHPKRSSRWHRQTLAAILNRVSA